MSYNPNYTEKTVDQLKVWISENPSRSIKQFSEENNLNYPNFRRFLARVGYARYPAKKSKFSKKVVFTTLDENVYAKLVSKAKKKKMPISKYIRNIVSLDVGK